MADEVFSFKVKSGPSGSVKFRVKVAQFGDGYGQAVGDGLNNRVQSYTVEVVSPTGSACIGQDEYTGAKAFLDRHAGFKSFLWSPPGEPEARWLCTGYTPKELGGGVYSLSAKFDQWFH